MRLRWVVARDIYLPDKKVPTFVKVAKDWLNYKKPNLRESRQFLKQVIAIW